MERDVSPVFGSESALGILYDITETIASEVDRGRINVDLIVTPFDVQAFRWIMEQLEKTWVVHV